jgi:hypothetical protein
MESWPGRNAAELLKDYVKDGKIEVESLKESAGKGVVASRIALEMLVKEGFKI